jgi:hypothetical protein
MRKTWPDKDEMIRWITENSATRTDVMAHYGFSKQSMRTISAKYGLKEYLKPISEDERIARSKEAVKAKYGVDNVFRLKSIQDKSAKTNVERYGFSSPNKNKEVVAKRKKTNLVRYGYAMPMMNKVIKAKANKTNLEKYGSACVLASPEIKNKISKTSDAKYGTPVIQSRDLTDIGKSATQSKEAMSAFIESQSDRTSKHLMDELGYESRTGFFIMIHKYGLFDLLDCDKETSFAEKEIADLIESLGFKVDRNRRDLLGDGREIDIYVPDRHLGIEYNGTYWHSDLKKDDKEYHQRKVLDAEKNGIHLIHIYEFQWENPVLKPIIISVVKLFLGLNFNRVYARDCVIKTIPESVSRPFCESNHMQGYVYAKITYGLFSKSGELLQLMSFGKPRYSHLAQWEIIRGCPGSNSLVVGGVSRLFSHFVKDNSPESVLSYCDLNMFDGKGYKAIGMNLVGVTKPNKWVILPDGRVIDRDPSKYEEYKGYPSIYGAGSAVYLWKK